MIPNTCLSSSELKNFLILFNINSEIKKIIGIEQINPKILNHDSK